MPILNHIKDISLVLEQLAYLYEFCRDGETFSFAVRDHSEFLVTTIDKEEEEGWVHEMLKLHSASRDPRELSSRFNPTSHPFAIDRWPTLEEVNMEEIEKALAFRDSS